MAHKSRRMTSSFMIGLFVMVGAVILTGVIIWLGASQFLKEQRFFVTYLDASVEGLEKGSAVKYQGVPVGSIKTIDVAPDGKLVQIIMVINKGIDINDSLRVKAEFAGIAGGKFLQLHYPENPSIARNYPAISFEPPYPVIKSSPSGLEELGIAAQEVMNNLLHIETGKISDETIKLLQTSSAFLGNQELYETISNLKTATTQLNSILAQVDTASILSNVTKATYNLVETSVQIEKTAEELNAKIAGLRLNESIEHVITSYDSTMLDTRRGINSIAYRSETMLFTLSETLEELKMTTRALRNSLEALSDHPSTIFLSKPPPQEE